ncbi:hypothetical protein C8Q74DRAFT_382237 [Fomes fomentarius]|nr:hypothetical protein C8Q74DRAFT_382237 [Fomes fomentarius]
MCAPVPVTVLVQVLHIVHLGVPSQPPPPTLSTRLGLNIPACSCSHPRRTVIKLGQGRLRLGPPMVHPQVSRGAVLYCSGLQWELRSHSAFEIQPNSPE